MANNKIQIKRSATNVTIPSLSNGELTLALSANQTSNITFGRYVYDAELIDGSGFVTRIVEGIITVTPEVSR